jgi:hypothetical protein
MKKQVILVSTIITAITVTTLVSEHVNAQTTNELPVYRLYNPNTGEHFYTESDAEENSLQNVGWNYEGIGWESATSGAPVYRVYNSNAKGGDHYYTMSRYEAQSLVNKGWHWDNNGNAVFYSAGNVNLYVSYNPNAQSGAHNYTTNISEQNNLLNVGWKYGAVAWKVEGAGKATAAPESTVQIMAEIENKHVHNMSPNSYDGFTFTYLEGYSLQSANSFIYTNPKNSFNQGYWNYNHNATGVSVISIPGNEVWQWEYGTGKVPTALTKYGSLDGFVAAMANQKLSIFKSKFPNEKEYDISTDGEFNSFITYKGVTVSGKDVGIQAKLPSGSFTINK